MSEVPVNIDDLQDFRKMVAERAHKVSVAKKPKLEEQTQAAVASNLLTGDPNWDVFLQQLQSKVESLEMALESVTTEFVTPGHLEAETLLGMHAAGQYYVAQIEAIRQIMGMPAELVKTGKDASEQLRTLSDTR